MTLFEFDAVTNRIREEMGEDDGSVELIIGQTFDDSMGDKLKVSIMATGMESSDTNIIDRPSYNLGIKKPLRPFMDDNKPDNSFSIKQENQNALKKEPTNNIKDIFDNLGAHHKKMEELKQETLNKDIESDVVEPFVDEDEEIINEPSKPVFVKEESKQEPQAQTTNNTKTLYNFEQPKVVEPVTPPKAVETHFVKEHVSPSKPGFMQRIMKAKETVAAAKVENHQANINSRKDEEDLEDTSAFSNISLKQDINNDTDSSINSVYNFDDDKDEEIEIPDFLK